MTNRTSLQILPLCLSVLAATLLSGCSANFAPTPLKDEVDSPQTQIGEITGSVHGGQAPVTGAQIYLFAAGTGGYGTAAKSLISSGKTGVTCNTTGTLNGDCYVKTDGNGNFALSGDYTCTAGTQVYMVAVGGNPGQAGTVNNTAIVQMAGLGECPSSGTMAQAVPFLIINEITTVSFAYAMGGFATDAYHIASSGTPLALTAIENAMRNSYNIVGLGWGGALPVANQNQNSTAPLLKINTLADIFATCVNTTAATTAACATLFSNAKNSSNVTPTDEATALFNIVHNPDANVAAIWARLPAQPVFTPTLASQPTDWTLPVVFKNAVSRPSKIAFDSMGNAWIADRTLNAVIKMSPQGAVTKIQPSGAGSIYDVAVDPSNVVWAADFTNNLIYRLDSSGSVLSTINTGSLNQPTGITFDAAGNAYVTNAGNFVISRYNSSGTALGGTVTSNAALGSSYAIAIDTDGNKWLPGYGTNCGCIVEVNNGSTVGTLYNNAPIIVNGFVQDSTAVAVDGSNTPWVANVNNRVLNIQTIDLGIFGSYVYNTVDATGGGLNAPATLSIDGAGNLWTANSGAATVSGFTNAGTALATNGFPSGGTGHTYAAAPDGAGNLWTANSDGTVVQLLGLATPTATPVLPGQFGTTP